MAKCKKCGNELRKGLSFCPKCGEVVTNNQSKNSVSSSVINTAPKTKKSPVVIILAILFFPITLTILIIKNKKMKPWLKAILILILWVFVIAVGSSEENSNIDTTKEEITTVEYSTTKKNETEKETTKKKKDQKEVKFHNDKTINKLINAYNKKTKEKITEDMVSNGAYSFKAVVYFDYIAVHISSNDNGIFIDYYFEADNDKAWEEIFTTFCKTLGVREKKINKAISELQTGQYKNYNYYEFDGITATYMTTELTNGQTRYTIKTNCKTFE